MAKRNSAEHKIDDPAEMIVRVQPPVDQHPGAFIRDTLLPEYGLSVAEAARRLKIDRAGFHGVLTGKYDVSRDLAYKLGALMRDEVADLLIAHQHAYSLHHETERRAAFRASIERLPQSADEVS